MADVVAPAFYAAHLRHFRQLSSEGVPGPFLQTVLGLSSSSKLFSAPFYEAHDVLVSRGAVAVSADSDIHPPLIFPSCILPCPDLFQICYLFYIKNELYWCDV
jgi:hypothetical protein